MPSERDHKNGNKNKKEPKRFRALINRWNDGSEDKNVKESLKIVDKNLLTQWEDCDHGSGSFEFCYHSQRDSSNKTSMKIENEKSINNYKAKNLEQKKLNGRKVPTRGMSARNKPANLKNIFVTKESEEKRRNSIISSADDDGAANSSVFFKKNSSEADMIRKGIEKNLFFDQMTSNELDYFIEAFEPVEVDNGIEIVTQGYLGDFFYIIGKEGAVSFHIDGVQVGEAAEGGSFGELSLLYSCPRATTAIAVSSPTKLFRVKRKTFRTLLQEQTKQKELEKIDLLKGVNFLSTMSEFDLNRLARVMTLNVFRDKDELVKKGEKGDAFYIVHEGRLHVTDISVGSTRFDSSILESGDYFGERALVTHEPRVANVTAVTNGSAFRIDRKTFERVLGKFSRVIMKSQDRKIMEGIQILQSSHLTTKQFEELANLVVDKKIEAGQTIFSDRKQTDAALYLVREGTVKVMGRRSDMIKPGAYFGDDLLLLDTWQDEVANKRAPTKTIAEYTAVAEESCSCGVLYLSDCRTIFDTTHMINTQSHKKGTEFLSEEMSRSEEVGKPNSPSVESTRRFSRESTNQWLKKSSKNGLRNAVKANVKFENLKKHDMLGEGQFGEVFSVSAYVSPKYGEQYFALKTQKKIDPIRGSSIVAIKQEIDLLGLMDHPFIVNLIHSYDYPEYICILMGLVHGGELFDVIHTELDGIWSSGIPECDAKFYTMVVTDTLDYMHRKQLVYRDLKPENVLIDKDGYPLICDFGFAKFVADKTYTLCGTPNYLSPEIIMNRGHDASTDHWALGILIYEMVAGENPFYYDGIPQMELFRSIVREKFYPLPDSTTDACFYVVDGLLDKDPNHRLGSLAGRGKDIMAKEWFKELQLDDLRQKKYTAPYIPEIKTFSGSDSDESFRSDADFSSRSMFGHEESDYNSSLISKCETSSEG